MSRSLAPTTALLTLLWGLSGCKDHPAREPAGPSPQPTSSTLDASSPPGALTGEILEPVEIPLLQLAGEVDVANRYLFTVLIEAQTSSAKADARRCSGVIIAPDLILTAGHCVCRLQSTESAPQAFIDDSACATTATLTAMTYLPPEPGESARAIHARYEGSIHPHPELKILLDEQGLVTSSHANLALILLTAPLPERFRPVKLAETNVAPNASLVTVGHGNDGSGADLYGKRRFNVTRVISLPAGEDRIFLDSPKQPLFANDSGGACLRETAQGFELIGISNRGLGKTPACTSIYSHRAWLRDEFLRADRRH